MSKDTSHNLRRGRGLGRDIQTLPDDGRPMRRKRILKRLKNLDIRSVLSRRFKRIRKWQQLYRTPHPSQKKVPVFILGCNRSGTNMVCGAIGNSPHGWDYKESEFSLAFNAYYLRADWLIEQLIQLTPAPIVSFGSILDSQFAGDLLDRFEGAKAIWIYRRYEDVANSCARMQWGPHLKNLVRWVARGELEKLGARGNHISNETIQLFGRLFREDISNEDSACLYWYMRNQLYYELNLYKDARVLLVQYEDAVLNKEDAFQRIFSFLDFPYDPNVINDIFASSVGKHPQPAIGSAIREVCDALQTRLDINYAKTSIWAPAGSTRSLTALPNSI
jgi:hypothetical protein